jgi:hypothetical protein
MGNGLRPTVDGLVLSQKADPTAEPAPGKLY